jgi:hypothetical protein
MMDAVTQVPAPSNEPVHSYALGSPERAALEARLKELAAEPLELPITISGEPIQLTQPHRRQGLLGRMGTRPRPPCGSRRGGAEASPVCGRRTELASRPGANSSREAAGQF